MCGRLSLGMNLSSKTVLFLKNLNELIKNRRRVRLQREVKTPAISKNLLGAQQKPMSSSKNKTKSSGKGAGTEWEATHGIRAYKASKGFGVLSWAAAAAHTNRKYGLRHLDVSEGASPCTPNVCFNGYRSPTRTRGRSPAGDVA